MINKNLMKIISWAIDLLVVITAVAININIIITIFIEGSELSTKESYIALALLIFAVNILRKRYND